ncbi:MAG: molecular chaperone TorD family protein, partial [Gemmatimonadetes bacterium]|nr:molecular chaperone TorD family protein [Gemmatimonadota bacterium]
MFDRPEPRPTPAELIRGLAVFAEPPTDEHSRIAEALGLESVPSSSEYSDLFLFQLYPYASVYLGPEGMLGGEARDRIAGFWRALEETPPPECDHLALMLSLYARLGDLGRETEDERGERFWAHARRAFFWEHLASWLPVFLDKLRGLDDGYYAGWGRLLEEALVAEATELAAPDEQPDELPDELPGKLPLHLREAPPLEDPRESSGEALLDSLLVPVRSGMILVRSDLERAARELDAGMRAGERKYALKALFGQDATATLGWLEKEARSWSEIHARRADGWGLITAFWSQRAS